MLGLRRSASINNTLPICASDIAKLAEVVVLPSPGELDVTAITLWSRSNCVNNKLVLNVRTDSAKRL